MSRRYKIVMGTEEFTTDNIDYAELDVDGYENFQTYVWMQINDSRFRLVFDDDIELYQWVTDKPIYGWKLIDTTQNFLVTREEVYRYDRG